MKKSEIYFSKELALIKDEKLREKTAFFLDEVAPDYFWTIPASSSGEYHPEFALGEGGLIRHIKMAIRIATDIFAAITDDYTSGFMRKCSDHVFSALIVHDCFKNGIINCGHTVDDHPLMCGIYARFLLDESVEYLIYSHMGRFGNFKVSTTEESIVHQADYIASRKWVNYDPL